MAYIRKFKRKWQALVRRKKIHVTKSFWKKGDATRWAYQVKAQIETINFIRIIGLINKDKSLTQNL